MNDSKENTTLYTPKQTTTINNIDPSKILTPTTRTNNNQIHRRAKRDDSLQQQRWHIPKDSEYGRMKRAAATSMIENSNHWNNASLQRRHTATIPTSCITSSPIKNISTTTTNGPTAAGVVSSSPKHKRISSLRKRYLLLSAALTLALLGIMSNVQRIIEYAQLVGTVTGKTDWGMKLASLGLPSGGGGYNVDSSSSLTQRTFSGSAYSGSLESNIHLVGVGGGATTSMKEKWARVREMSRERVRRRRVRTSPTNNHGGGEVTSSSSFAGTTAMNGEESIAPPRLVLDVPSHRPLSNNVDTYSNAAYNNKSNNQKLRRLQPTTVCGPHASEASQLYPNHYPPNLSLSSSSRVIVTGALSQLGMETILSLSSQCGISYILGIDSIYPNTRHDRIETMEWRYKYLASRVPGFQKLMVPVFGIHPHSRVGEEVKYEAEGNGFDIVRRFQPTHVIHLAGMEEGMGEHVDYGDVSDVSPFVTSSSSDMMRRFESLVSMDQVLLALRNGGEAMPQLVYVSSNEVERSGVNTVLNGEEVLAPKEASVYGTISLMKEIMASYYHRHHGVRSIGLRVPTLLGPFARPGSVVHDLAERTVRNAAGKNVKGVPKYHADRDRYELSTIWAKREGAKEGQMEQVAFASDVAQAILSALQFRDDTDPDDGPTIIRLGSRFTTSMKDIKDRMEGYLPSYNQWESSGETASSSSLSMVTTATSRGLSIYDANRNRDLIGWAHSTRLHEGTKSILAWHVLKAYPFGLPKTVPSHEVFQQILADSFSIHDRHSLTALPCAAGCRWSGFCTSSGWDNIIEVTKSMTQSCPYVLYTVDLRPELVRMEKQSTPSQRSGWEDRFCKIAFVSSSSKLAKATYGHVMTDGTPQHEWNGKRKDGYWYVVVVDGSQYTLNEAERSMLKLAPNNMFNDRVEKAMYINHRRVCLTTDQATGVMRHLEMKGRDHTDKKTIIGEDKTEIRVKLPPRAPRHSIFFTNRYIFADDFDTSNARNLAKFVMTNMGIAETSDIRRQLHFYQETGHLTRTNTGRSANYQEFFQENPFPFDFLRTTWLVHELQSQEGRDLRCEMYQEHAMWGNNDMEDLSIGYVLASRKVRMQLGSIAAPEYEGPEEWYPLLVPKEPTDEDAITEGPVYLDYLEEAQKVTKDETGSELFITFLPQKRE